MKFATGSRDENKGAGKPATKCATTSTRRSDKRKAEMQAAAVLNGFETWSGMMTFIKNEALKGNAVVIKNN